MSVTSDAPAAGEWRQHGTVLLPCLAGMMLCSVTGYSVGVLIGPLEREFGWSRAEISAGPLIISSMGLFLSPLVGIGIDRFGPRRIGLAGVIAFCAGLAFLSTSNGDILSWWLRWGLLGLAANLIMSPVWTAAINSLFERNRGKALALALCGTGLSAAFVPSLANFLIERQGWRQALVSMGGMLALLVVPLVFFFFHGAMDRRRASATPGGPVAMLAGYTPREGLVSPAFLKLAAAGVVFGVTSCALTVNSVPVLMAKGFGTATAAGLAGLIGLGSIAGRLGGGFLLDRFDARKVAAASVAAPIVFVLLLMGLPGSATAAAVACFALGLSVGTEVDACAYLAARHFGMRSFGTLFGTMAGMLLFGAGVAPVVSNMVYDATRSYDIMLWAIVPLCLMATGLFLWLGGYPAFDRREAVPAGTAEAAGAVLATP